MILVSAIDASKYKENGVDAYAQKKAHDLLPFKTATHELAVHTGRTTNPAKYAQYKKTFDETAAHCCSTTTRMHRLSNWRSSAVPRVGSLTMTTTPGAINLVA